MKKKRKTSFKERALLPLKTVNIPSPAKTAMEIIAENKRLKNRVPYPLYDKFLDWASTIAVIGILLYLIGRILF